MEEEDITKVMARMVRNFARQRGRIDDAYEYDRREFDRWLASVKGPWSAMKAFREFEHRFAQLSDQDRSLLGADKVLPFFKSVNEKRIVVILSELKEDDGANGLTEDWNEVERV